MERQQQIDFYISDYNLKVLAYKDVFFAQNPQKPVMEFVAQRKANATDDKRNLDEFIKAENNADNNADSQQDYDLEDALISIKNLDYHLDKSYEDDKTAPQLVGDSDTEFILDASNLISQDDLDKIINNIENLNQCSLEREMEESTQGMGFVFVVLAEAISQFNMDADRSALSSSTWAIIFFLMILALGLDSQFGNMEGLISSLMDLNMFTKLNRQYLTGEFKYKSFNFNQIYLLDLLTWNETCLHTTTGIICAVSLVISLFAFAHGAGSYIFAIFDEFASNFSLVLIALFELLAISYIYGLRRFHDDCELMTGKRPNLLILISWRYVSPILLLVIILATMKQFSVELNYEAWVGDHMETREWPSWCTVLGSLLIVSCTIWIPLVMVLNVLKMNLLPKEELNRRWFPADELREYHGLQEEGTRQFSRWERVLFGFSNDDDY